MTIFRPTDDGVGGDYDYWYNNGSPGNGQEFSVEGGMADDDDATYLQIGIPPWGYDSYDHPESWYLWPFFDAYGDWDSVNDLGKIRVPGVQAGTFTFSIRTSRAPSEEFGLVLDPFKLGISLSNKSAYESNNEGPGSYSISFGRYENLAPGHEDDDVLLDWDSEEVVQHDFTLTLTTEDIAGQLYEENELPGLGNEPCRFTLSLYPINDEEEYPLNHPEFLGGLRIHDWWVDGVFPQNRCEVRYEPYDLNVDYTTELYWDDRPDAERKPEAALTGDDTALTTSDNEDSTALVQSPMHNDPYNTSMLTFKMRPREGEDGFPDGAIPEGFVAASATWSAVYLSEDTPWVEEEEEPTLYPAFVIDNEVWFTGTVVDGGYESYDQRWDSPGLADPAWPPSLAATINAEGYFECYVPGTRDRFVLDDELNLTKTWITRIRLNITYEPGVPTYEYLPGAFGWPPPFGAPGVPWDDYPMDGYPLGTNPLVSDGYAYIYEGDVSTNDPEPHIWFVYQKYGFGNIPFVIYGRGLGALQSTWDGLFYGQSPPAGWNGLGRRPANLPASPAPVLLETTDWETQAAGGEAYTANRSISAGTTIDLPATTNIEADIVEMTVPNELVPSLLAGPKGLKLYVITENGTSNQLNWTVHPFIPVPLGSVSGNLRSVTKAMMTTHPLAEEP